MTEAGATSDGGPRGQEAERAAERGPGQWAERAANATECGI